MKYYYLCFKKEALIVQETFLNWYVNVAKKYFLCHSTLHPVNIHIKRPNDGMADVKVVGVDRGEVGTKHRKCFFSW